MSAPTKSYYIDINRFSAQDSESDQTNIWDYNLNDTIVAPSGSQISVHQAFINQKGITGQSIEFEEDISETIYYYGYISEMEHIVPTPSNPVETKRGEKNALNSQPSPYLNLLNNAASGATSVVGFGRGLGRRGLWGINGNVTEGTYQHLDAHKFGGCGVPLILSDPPEPDDINEFELSCSITKPRSIGSTTDGANMRVTNNSTEFTITNWDVVVNGGQLRNIGGMITARRVAPYVQDPQPPIIFNSLVIDGAINSETGVGNFTNAYPDGGSQVGDAPDGIFNIDILNSDAFLDGQVGVGQYPAGKVAKVGMRVYDKNGNKDIPMGCRIKGGATFSQLGFQLENLSGSIVDLGAVVKNNVPIFLTEDLNYYCSPRPLSAQITVPKGTYGIQQVVSLINNQLSGLASPSSKAPQKPYDSAIINSNYDGMINQGTQGFTTKIKPIRYRDAPDSVHQAEIHPEKNPVLGATIPDHTFISALDYAILRNTGKALNNKTRVNFTTKLAGTGYVAYMMDNNVQGVAQNSNIASGIYAGLTLVSSTIPFAFGITGEQFGDLTNIASQSGVATTINSNLSSKANSDYIIGRNNIESITIGSPEANLQFDTDTSSFSLNNLHASWRIPSNDIMGQEIPNKGEVGVGLKRCAEICDVQPYTEFQKIWGATGRDNIGTSTGVDQLRGRTIAETNIIDSIAFVDLTGHAGTMSYMSIGAKLTPVNAHPHINSATHLPLPDAAGNHVEIIEIIPAIDTLASGNGIPKPTDARGFFSVRVKFPTAWNSNKQVFKSNVGTDTTVNFTIVGQGTGTDAERTAMISSFQKPKSRTGGVIIYNFAQATALKYGDRPSVISDTIYNKHGSYDEFFTNKTQAKKIWKTKTIWGKLGFSYQQFNNENYFENIVQYANPTFYKLRGITSDTVLDTSTIPTISTLSNPADIAATDNFYPVQSLKAPQVYNNFDFNTPRTELQRDWDAASGGSGQMAMTGANPMSYSGSIHSFTTMVNVVAKPTPLAAEDLPTLSKFGYYLITSDLVPTYKDIVSKGDPLGLLGVVAKTSLSSQDFIPLAQSDIVQVLNQNTNINNIRIKILNPDLTNPNLNENSSVILRIDVPIEPPQPTTEETAKSAKSEKKKKSKK